MKEFQFTHFGQTFRGCLGLANYQNNNNTAVQLYSWNEEFEGWEEYARLSCNTPLKLGLAAWFAAKTYSENEGLVEQFIEMGLFEDTGQTIPTGHVVCPILKLTDKAHEYLMEQSPC